jgi:hypothetical protein
MLELNYGPQSTILASLMLHLILVPPILPTGISEPCNRFRSVPLVSMTTFRISATAYFGSCSVTFFYPSTEWEMAQPFKCKCGAAVRNPLPSFQELIIIPAIQTCLGIIKGAAYLSVEELNRRGFINQWILDLAAEQVSLRVPARARVKCLNCSFGFSTGGDSERCGCKPTTMT